MLSNSSHPKERIDALALRRPHLSSDSNSQAVRSSPMQTNIFESVTPNILSFLRAYDDALQGAKRPRTGGYSSIYDFLLKNGSGWRNDHDSQRKPASGVGSFREAGLTTLLIHRWT